MPELELLKRGLVFTAGNPGMWGCGTGVFSRLAALYQGMAHEHMLNSSEAGIGAGFVMYGRGLASLVLVFSRGQPRRERYEKMLRPEHKKLIWWGGAIGALGAVAFAVGHRGSLSPGYVRQAIDRSRSEVAQNVQMEGRRFARLEREAGILVRIYRSLQEEIGGTEAAFGQCVSDVVVKYRRKVQRIHKEYNKKALHWAARVASSLTWKTAIATFLRDVASLVRLTESGQKRLRRRLEEKTLGYLRRVQDGYRDAYSSMLASLASCENELTNNLKETLEGAQDKLGPIDVSFLSVRPRLVPATEATIGKVFSTSNLRGFLAFNAAWYFGGKLVGRIAKRHFAATVASAGGASGPLAIGINVLFVAWDAWEIGETVWRFYHDPKRVRKAVRRELERKNQMFLDRSLRLADEVETSEPAQLQALIAAARAATRRALEEKLEHLVKQGLPRSRAAQLLGKDGLPQPAGQ